MGDGPSNDRIARRLDEVADRLAALGADEYRVRAWHRAATAVRTWPRPLLDVWAEGGLPALQELPGVGERIGAAIDELLGTGSLSRLERLRADMGTEASLRAVPGLGRRLIARLSDLGIRTLDDLELAARTGELERVPGFGARRVAAIGHFLAARRQARARLRPGAAAEPDVGELLDVDLEYRERASRGELPRVSPHRFNPEGASWLPLLHTERGPTAYTAVYSNTALAHASGATADWVVLYFSRGLTERQRTVVTETAGPMAGLRVVRGREPECRRHYRALGQLRRTRPLPPPPTPPTPPSPPRPSPTV